MPVTQIARTGLIDKSAAREAVELALPSLEKALKRPDVSGEQGLHLVIVDPLVKYGSRPFKNAVLYEYSVGNPEAWDADYRAFARDRAELAWRTDCNIDAIREEHPQVPRLGNHVFWGGVCKEGIIVTARGSHSWFDEAFADIVASFLIAIGEERARSIQEREAAAPGGDGKNQGDPKEIRHRY